MEKSSCPTCGLQVSAGTLYCPEDGTEIPRTAPAAPESEGPEARASTRRRAPSARRPGLKVGGYVLEKKLGEGGMGEVWSARQPEINKQVAVKLLNDRMSANPTIVTRFVQEARAVNEIQHENIIDIFAFGELSDGRPYFV